MKQQDLDRLRKKVGPEFSHLLGEVDEEEGLGIDGGEGEDDGFHKTMGAIFNRQSAARSTNSVPTVAQDLEMKEFMKGGLTEVGIQMSREGPFPLPKPQPGPSKPGPSSPTGHPTGQPYPTRRGNQKVREAGFRFLSIMQTLRKSAQPGTWEQAVEDTLQTVHDVSLKEIFDSIKQNDVDGLMAAVKRFRQGRSELVGFA
jgi:hypothetical protein